MTKQIGTLYKCDAPECKKLSMLEVNPQDFFTRNREDIAPHAAPAGWHALHSMSAKEPEPHTVTETTELHFCTLVCLKRWSTQVVDDPNNLTYQRATGYLS
jgi:hypothetical protein